MKRLSSQSNTRRLVSTVSRILVLCILAGTFFLLLNRRPWEGYALEQYQGTRNYEEETWVFRHGDRVEDPALTLPAFRKLTTGETYSISTPLTYDPSADRIPTCFFFVDHMFCRALMDGEVLFSYMPQDIQKDDRGRSPGNVYVSFPLPEDGLGKELVIEFVPALGHDIEFQFPNPHFGNYATQAIYTFRSELPHNLIVILAAFLGVVSILFSTLALTGSKYREGIFIGIFATLFSLYNLTESDFDFYIISNPYYTYLIDYTTFSLVPILLMAFFRERLDKRQRWVASVMIGVGVVMFLAEIVLHFTGLMDMREFLSNLHIVYFSDFILIFVLLVTMKKNRWKTQLILQMIPILAGMLIDAAVYYEHWQLSSSDSTFTCLGVIIFLITELFHVWKYSIEVYSESVRSETYRQMAYVDALTGIGNRRAFDVEKRSITTRRRGFQVLTVASVDVNDLKLTNDSLGHAAGDQLIRNAADVLSQLASDDGRAFRIGGDEFALILYDVPEPEFRDRLAAMEARIRTLNQKCQAQLSLALGFEVTQDTDADAIFQHADRKMYQDKARQKAGRDCKPQLEA